jgi:FMN phosphatase YigB (HAD superfamily)
MKHFSFDFWNTIGKPNKDYARGRAALLADVFGTDTATAKARYTSVKNALDHAAETEGCDHGRDYNLARLCEAFEREDDRDFRDTLGRHLDDLFAEHPPMIDPALREQLHRAHDQGITLSIGSNTNFITGRVIMEHAIGRLPFAFTVFSDEVASSKPNPAFFAIIAEKARAANPLVMENTDIVHIGDSRACDIAGGARAGMQVHYTTNADATAAEVAVLLGGQV